MTYPGLIFFFYKNNTNNPSSPNVCITDQINVNVMTEGP